MILPAYLAVLVTTATVAMGKTPEGFKPATNADLIVDYSGIPALNGAVVSRSPTGNEPRIGTASRLNGSSYAVMMIDIDIPTNSPPQTNTLIHWLQTGLTQATTATTLNTTSGPVRVFLMENRANTTAITPYFGPNPPARIPLSHRYTQILVDTTSITTQAIEIIRTAANTTRIGFNAEIVLSQANLAGRVVAGNFYNVTNPGPVQSVATNTSTTITSGVATNTAAFEPGTSTGRPATAIIATGSTFKEDKPFKNLSSTDETKKALHECAHSIKSANSNGGGGRRPQWSQVKLAGELGQEYSSVGK
ncbi:phosphatidylethanolamine-binding protein [Podospora didyma]|uniref:Phosphatidylethanolamine-binding protein n=1 Tax=Podospora didyma TaxID=330526 RepID=A0AAE0NBS3_9PEZI|nr:phosphatidylethanolamine-binding protein [Podospora didyma]